MIAQTSPQATAADHGKATALQSVTGTAGTVRVVIHERLEDITATEWEDLRRRSPGCGMFQSYAWHQAVVRSLGAGDGLYLVCVRDNSRYLAIAPFFRTRRGSATIFRLLGDTHAARCDILADAGADWVLNEIFDHFKARAGSPDELHLANVPCDSPTVRALGQLHAKRQLLILRNETAHNLTPDPARLFSNQDGNGPGLPDGTEVLHLSSPEDMAPHLNDLFAHHIQARADSSPSPFVARRNRDFCRCAARELAPEGAMVLTVLRFSGRTAALHLGFVDRSVLFWRYYAPCAVPTGANTEADASSKPPEAVLLRKPTEDRLSGPEPRALEMAMFRSLAEYARQRNLAALDISCASPGIRTLAAPPTGTTVSMTLTFPKGTFGPARAKAALRRSRSVRELSAWRNEVVQTAYVLLNAGKVVDAERRAFSDARTAEQFYDSVVSDWIREFKLQKAELAVLRELRAELPGMRMLDIGAGGGRTSVYFAPLVREYVAVDASRNMVEACRELLCDLVPPACFNHGDARDLKGFADRSFDFVLFSFNGIDCVSPGDRTRVLREVKRVARSGAWFCFSSHNLGSLTWRGARGPLQFLRRWRRYRLLAAANPDLAGSTGQPSALVSDAGHHFLLPLFYTTGAEQVRRLHEMGFSDVRVLSPRTGEVVQPDDKAGARAESWLYYLCRT